MSCNCVHEKEEIENGYRHFDELRELFIRRMTEDSETQDRRSKKFNQAIFFYRDDGTTCACFSDTDMDMVLQCFDDAVKDWRRTFCDVEGCARK